mgnify:CR=1 FL=1|tara:strand:+ start:2738 stop:3289 length:552 start_codon:yes stop_codon:yes gene_type:complete
MQLFELKDFALTWSPQALSLKVFGDLWKRDKTKDKEIANGELAFIFYFTDGRSDFNNILDEDTRVKEILEQIGGLPNGWKPDAKVKVAIDFYKERTKTISSMLLEDAEYAVGKVSKFLRNVNLDEKTDKGAYLNDAKKITDTIKTLPAVVDSLQETKKKVQKELNEASGARGSIEKGIFEDDI